MRTLRSTLLLALALAATLGVDPAVARADSLVLVLGIRTLDGDNEMARHLTRALRNAADQVRGWTVSERELTLDQAMLLSDCDELDIACLDRVAGALAVQQLIYGEIRRTSTEGDYDFEVEVHFFDADTSRVTRSIEETLPGAYTDLDHLRAPTLNWVNEASDIPRVGSILVRVNVPDAEVFVGDEAVGRTGPDGQLSVPNVSAGNRALRLVAEGYASLRSSVAVEPFAEALFEAQLVRPEPGLSPSIAVGAAFMVAAAGFLGGWIATLVRLDDLDGDADYRAYRTVVALGQADGMVDGNVCQNAADGNGFGRLDPGDPILEGARGVCSDASLFEALQWVFLGAAVVSAGVGTYFLLDGLQGDSSSRVQLRPSFGPQRARLDLRVAF